MLAIGTNASALMAQAATASVQIDAETAMQRLSSGKRINAAKDDAAGVAIASRMTSHVRGLHQSIRNSMDAQALISTAEGGLQETEALLQRIRELAVQASNDTNSDADRTNLNNEAQQLLAGIDAIASGTTWAGQNLLDGTYSSKSFQVGGGTMAVDQLSTSIAAATASALGVGTSTNTVETTTTETTTSYVTTSNNVTTTVPVTTTITTTNTTQYQTPNKLGASFQINNTDGTIGRPKGQSTGAKLTNGNFVSTWMSLEQDGSGYGIYAQILDDIGNKIGSEIQVNAYTNSDQKYPSVAALSNGGFAISWDSKTQDSEANGVYGAIFNAQGSSIISEFRISASGSDDGPLDTFNPQIHSNLNGQFVVGWQEYENYSYKLKFQIFSNSGTAIGGINTADFFGTNNWKYNPSLSSFSDNSFILAFQGADLDGTNSGIMGQIFDSSGNLSVNPFLINESTPSTGENDVSLASLTSGNVVSIWAGPYDGINEGIWGRIIDSDGNLVGSQFQVDSSSNSSQKRYPNVASLSDGGFIAVWSGSGIHGQRFNSSGTKIGSEFLVSSGGQPSAVVGLEDGRFAVSWTDGTNNINNVLGQLFETTSTTTSTISTTTYETNSSIVSTTTPITTTNTVVTTGTTSVSSISLESKSDATSAINRLDTALQTLSSQRASLGALSNRLDNVITNNTNTATNSSKSLGRIQDADFAAETTKLAKSKILEQSSTAMLAQANASVYEVLTLIPD